MEVIRNFRDYGYTVKATIEDHHVDFEVFEIEGECSDGQLLWHRAGSPVSPDPVESLDEAQVFLSGYVKWDGCSNWLFNQDLGMIHECSRLGLVHIGSILAACWDMAGEFCPKWDGD